MDLWEPDEAGRELLSDFPVPDETVTIGFTDHFAGYTHKTC